MIQYIFNLILRIWGKLENPIKKVKISPKDKKKLISAKIFGSFFLGAQNFAFRAPWQSSCAMQTKLLYLTEKIFDITTTDSNDFTCSERVCGTIYFD